MNMLQKERVYWHIWILLTPFFSLKLAYLIFAAAEQFSINLQAKHTTITEGIKWAKLLKLHYTSMRTDESFSTFYHGVPSSIYGVLFQWCSELHPSEKHIPRCYFEKESQIMWTELHGFCDTSELT